MLVRCPNCSEKFEGVKGEWCAECAEHEKGLQQFILPSHDDVIEDDEESDAEEDFIC